MMRILDRVLYVSAFVAGIYCVVTSIIIDGGGFDSARMAHGIAFLALSGVVRHDMAQSN